MRFQMPATSKDYGVFEKHESGVRYYCRAYPALFERAAGTYLTDVDGRTWLDFLSGAGSLNYGHNHPALKDALCRYIAKDGVVSSLDLFTTAKRDFLQALNEIVLAPGGLFHRCQFCGPTGTNAVEAAVKLARKVTGRREVVAFTGSYHGMTAGSMALSDLLEDEYVTRDDVTIMPFDGTAGAVGDTGPLRRLLGDRGSGRTLPAAFIVEPVQGEGGVNAASRRWMEELSALAREMGALLIVDEIQSGCGRTGEFFAFQQYGIAPDLVCVSKSISGMGLPMSIVLIGPELDRWRPGEHSGTFRGFAYAFVTGAEALRFFWRKETFREEMTARSKQLGEALRSLASRYPGSIRTVRRTGLMAGIVTAGPAHAAAVRQGCWRRGLIVETCGRDGEVVKLLPPLTITRGEMAEGMDILDEVFGGRSEASASGRAGIGSMAETADGLAPEAAVRR